MPISENELMWAKTLPEEVEAGAPEVLATGGPSATGAGSAATSAEVETRAEAAAEAAEAEPVVRVEETSRLEATLARLEMNSIQIKMHLDSLEQRMGRMEPPLEAPLRGVAERTPEAEPLGAREVEQERPPTTLRPTLPAEGSATAEPGKGREAKEDRWSHLMGPNFDLPGAASPVPFAGVAEAPGKEMRSVEADSATALRVMPVDASDTQFVRQPEAWSGTQTAARPAMETEAWPASKPEVRSAMQPEIRFARRPEVLSESQAPALPAIQPEMSTARPFPVDRVRFTEARPEGREPAGEFAAPEPARPFPMPRNPTSAAWGTAREERGERLPAPRMFSPFEEPNLRQEVPVGGPRMWRGYRVSRIVLAAVLLVLAAIPLAIWWRLSVDARDADAGDAAPASRVEPGAAVAPSEKPSAAELASTAVRREAAKGAGQAGSVPIRGAGEVAGRGSHLSAGDVAGGSSYAGAGPVAGGSRSPVASGGAAPVIRRAPSTTAGPYAAAAGSVARPIGGRTSGGLAAVGGTSIGLRGQPGGSDVVQGTSGVRVRVPEVVMAERLLPTGDVGELPRGSGEVVAAMFISNTGRVEEVQVISGNKGLRDAATRAMRNWRYEPFVQGGVRVPVVTTASIRFDGGSAAAR